MELKESYGEIAARNAEVLPVTTDDLARARPAIEAFDPPFPMPYDTTDEVPKLWDRFGKFGTDLADAAVFIIDRDGQLAWQSLGKDYTHQVNGAVITRELDRLAQ